MSSKRSICCGVPVFVSHKIFLPYFVTLGVVVVFFLGSIIKEGRGIVDLWFDSVATGIGLLGFPILAFIATTALFSIRLSRYIAHFRKHGGRVCFVCNYPLDASLERCSECGMDWDPTKLNAAWKARVEQAAGDD